MGAGRRAGGGVGSAGRAPRPPDTHIHTVNRAHTAHTAHTQKHRTLSHSTIHKTIQPSHRSTQQSINTKSSAGVKYIFLTHRDDVCDHVKAHGRTRAHEGARGGGEFGSWRCPRAFGGARARSPAPTPTYPSRRSGPRRREPSASSMKPRSKGCTRASAQSERGRGVGVVRLVGRAACRVGGHCPAAPSARSAHLQLPPPHVSVSAKSF